MTGRPATFTRTDGLGARVLAKTYDGRLLTQEAWSGTDQTAGTVAYIFDDDLRLDKVNVNGQTVVDYGLDADGLTASASSLQLQRSTANGLVTGTTLGQLTTTRTLSAFDERDREQAVFN